MKGISGRVKGKAYRYIGNMGMKGNPIVAIFNFEKVIKIPDAAPEDKKAAKEYIDLLEDSIN